MTPPFNPSTETESLTKQQMTRADLSVVIVSWNVAVPLADCLESLVRHAGGLSLEVWVVDNASSDNTLEILQDRYPWVRIIANRENRGFASANNQAIKLACARFTLILNPDTILSEGSLENLLKFLLAHPQAGAVGPALRRPDGEPDYSSARRLPSLASVFCLEALRMHSWPLVGLYLHRKLDMPYDHNTTQPVEAISGAAMLVRSELLQEIGGFGEVFMHCGEDIDLCFRIRKAGWEIWYVAESVIVHLGGQSTKVAPAKTAVNAALSNQQYFCRCYGERQGIAFRCIIQLVEVPCLMAIGLVKFLLGRERAADFKRRFRIIQGLIAWRSLK